MALKKCKECGHEISSDAKTCPNCGKKQGISTTVGCLTIIVVFIFIGAVSNWNQDTGTQTKEPDQNLASLTPHKSQPKQSILTKQGEKIKKKHPGWPDDVCNTIAEKKIHIGMDREQVIAAWGKPHEINETTGTYGVHEQWVMSEGFKSDYLYFDDGILTTIQQSR